MKVFAIGDLHMSFSQEKPMDIFGESWENYLEEITEDWKKRVSDDDIVLLCGDLSWAMHLEDAIPDINYVAALPGIKVILKGNHDYWWQSIAKLREVLPENFYAIQNDAIKIGDYIICGSRGWTCPDGTETEEDRKIFNREVLRLKMSLDSMEKLRTKDERVILMMHFPPFNVRREDNDITKLIFEHDIRTVIYGHLHGKESSRQRLITKGSTKFYLTSCDQVDNKLVEL